MPTATAHATPPQPGPGLPGCRLAVVPSDVGDPGYRGVVSGGPVVIADLFANAVDGTLRCTPHVDNQSPYVLADSGTES